ncbi:MAG: deaminase [Chitinophagaceae bacterium]|nr:deaminase [Chitinophagaceae bacterium]
MRKLILEVQVSIDGYIAGTGGNTEWMLWNWGPDWKWDDALQKYHTDLTKSADCILLSRQMAEEGFIAHWAKTAEIPDGRQFAFARHITDTRKMVFTKTLTQSDPIPGGWHNTDIANGDLVSEINRLKNQGGKNIIVYGGASFVASLIKAGLIDEYQLFINPTAIGKGMTIFKELDSHLNLSLVNSKYYACGMVVTVYQPGTKLPKPANAGG